ncbi:unnamed protein product [Rhodiola kirilowii]
MSDRTPDEPPTAPEHDRWYNLALGPTFKDESANRLCSLKYEFKPASIDKSRAGSMHKRKDNRVSVEFQNNQPGKPKVVFEGSSEDYKENEAVLIFDGKSFRLERLHRAVKQLRHVRLPGDGAASVSALAPTPESRLSPVIKPGKAQQYAKPIPPAVPVEVERIDVGEPAISGGKATGHVTPPAHSYAPPEKSLVYEEPPKDKKWDDQDTLMEDLFGSDDTAAEKEKAPIQKIDVATEGQQNESDDEIIADVDVDDDEATRGLSAAEALRAQVFSEAKGKSTSSSSSSGTSSSSSGSDSGSASSSSRDSEGSDVNSV